MTTLANAPWLINSGIGIGHLEFGQTRADVEAFAGIYGQVTRVLDGASSAMAGISDDDFDRFLSDLGLLDALSDEEKAAASAFDQELRSQSANIIDERRMGDFTLSLEYVDDALYSITTDALNSQIAIEDMPIFSTDPATLLHRLQVLNGDAAVSGSNVIFARLGLLISGLYFQNEYGVWTFYREDANRLRERSITVFAPQELDRYLTNGLQYTDFGNKLE